MTDAEIKKALECCILGDCQGCFYGDTDQRHCKDDLMQNALDLINRKEEEKAELVGNVDRLNVELQAMRNAANGFKAEVERLKKELLEQKLKNNMLFETSKEEIERLSNHIQEGIGLANQLPEMMALVKAEAYKEAFEKVKSELKNISKFDFHGTYYYLVGEAFFDNLLNELVGDENETR